MAGHAGGGPFAGIVRLRHGELVGHAGHTVLVVIEHGMACRSGMADAATDRAVLTLVVNGAVGRTIEAVDDAGGGVGPQAAVAVRGHIEAIPRVARRDIGVRVVDAALNAILDVIQNLGVAGFLVFIIRRMVVVRVAGAAELGGEGVDRVISAAADVDVGVG